MRESTAQVFREVIDHLTRIVLDPVDERGLAPPQHRQAQRVQPRDFDDSAVVAQLSLASMTGTSSHR